MIFFFLKNACDIATETRSLSSTHIVNSLPKSTTTLSVLFKFRHGSSEKNIKTFILICSYQALSCESVLNIRCVDSLTFSLDELRLAFFLLLLSHLLFLWLRLMFRQQRIHQYQKKDDMKEDSRSCKAGRHHNDITEQIMPHKQPQQRCSKAFSKRSQCFENCVNNPIFNAERIPWNQQVIISLNIHSLFLHNISRRFSLISHYT